MLIVLYLYYKFDLFRFIKYLNINTVEKAKGIGIFNNIMKSFMFVGLNINVALILYLGDKKNKFNKLIIFFMIENLILALNYLFDWYVLPSWFKYVERLKFLYKIKFFDRDDKNLPHLKFNDIIKNYEKNDNLKKTKMNVINEENNDSNITKIELIKNE